jgi:hypothetical protein
VGTVSQLGNLALQCSKQQIDLIADIFFLQVREAWAEVLIPQVCEVTLGIKKHPLEPIQHLHFLESYILFENQNPESYLWSRFLVRS